MPSDDTSSDGSVTGTENWRDRRIAELEAENAQLRLQLMLRDVEIVRLKTQFEQQEKRIADLVAQVEELRRGCKRQAAPFSKGSPKENPKTPGRKPGDKYGRQVYRAVPPRIDETYEARLPGQCPRCGGFHINYVKTCQQYQAEIPRRPIYRQFNVAVGECVDCGGTVQGRHPLQTSDALGAAASQIGPEAQSAIVMLNKELGLSHGKIARFFEVFFGISLSRGGSCRIMLRAAERLEGDYKAIIQSVQQSGPNDMAVPDETGWRIGGHGAWLHVAVGTMAVAYLIDESRGIEAIVKVLGTTFAGILVHDGFRSYDQFNRAAHQACLGHLLKRCGEMLEEARGSAAQFPRKVKALLQESLEVRDQRDAGQIQPEAAVRKAGQLGRRMGALIRPHKTNPNNERFAKHLRRNLGWLFTFLRRPGVDATNHQAEQAIRPAVVNRKVWGGNRTEAGAVAQMILMSVLGTCRKRGRQALEYIQDVLRNQPTPPLLPVSSG
jgi:transposase